MLVEYKLKSDFTAALFTLDKYNVSCFSLTTPTKVA